MSNNLNWIYLVIAIVSETIGTSALKQAEGFTKLWPSIIVLMGYSASFYFLSMTLKSIPVGIAYAIWSGIGTTLITVIGWIYFKQSLNLPTLIGMALIIAGTIVINMFSKAASH
jgi:small multidrug resistance pump